MNYKLCLFVSASLLYGCSTNKPTEADKQMLDIRPSSNHQLVKANSAHEYDILGKRYEEKLNYDLAAISYQKALKIEPNRASSLSGLAMVYAKQDLISIALPLLEKVVLLEPNAKNYNNLGYAYYLNQQYDEAARVLNQALTLNPNYQQATNNLALVNKNIEANKEVQELQIANTDSDKKVDFVVVNPVNGESSASNLANIAPTNDVVVENNIQSYQLIDKGSSVYEISSRAQQEAKLIATTTTNEYVAEQLSKHSVEFKNAETSQRIAATESGGVSLNHLPVVSKLFDLATVGIVDIRQQHAKWVEVVNGNGLKGIARTVTSKLNNQGLNYVRAKDAKSYNISQTHIQYRTGHRDDAVALNHHLLNRPMLYRNDKMPTNVSVRLILGRDILSKDELALIDSASIDQS